MARRRRAAGARGGAATRGAGRGFPSLARAAAAFRRHQQQRRGLAAGPSRINLAAAPSAVARAAEPSNFNVLEGAAESSGRVFITAYDDKGFTVGGRDLDSSILCVGDVALCWSPSCLADVTPDSLPQCVLALLTPSLHSSLSVPSCPATTSFSPRSHLVLTSFSPRSHLVLTSFSPLSHLVLTSFSPLSHLFLTSFSPLSHLFLTSFSPRSHLFLTSFSPLSHLFSPLSHLFLTSFSPLSHTPNNRRGLRLSLPSILPIFLWLICEFHQFFPISLPGLQFRLYLPPSLPYFLLTSTSLPAPLYPLFIPSTPLPSFCPPCHPCLSLPHSLALFQLIRQQPGMLF
ncbi:unnamed protein product [Closterium sp. NIES-64]|nr:unnamed protein product [Closterium sp. NIES-64]